MAYKFIVYKTATGEVVRTGECDIFEDVALQAQAGETSVENTGDFTESYFWDGTTFTLRPDLDTICSLTGAGSWVADGVTQVTYGTAIPVGATVEVYSIQGAIPPTTATISDGTFALTTNFPGDYVVTISAFPFLNKLLELTAT